MADKPEKRWFTALSQIEPNKVVLRGYAIDELMGQISFAQAVYLLWKGELPSPAQARLLDAILVSSIDHGAGPPSAWAARNAASTGAPLNACVASGILAINRSHGGAIEEAMQAIEQVHRLGREVADLAAGARETVAEYKNRGQRVGGFGHRLHSDDPRAKTLFALAGEAGFSGAYLAAAKALEKAISREAGKPLPINVDGAIAAVLLEMGIDHRLANAFFMLARVPGLVAQALEEKTREKPMRHIQPELAQYDGPPPRSL